MHRDHITKSVRKAILALMFVLSIVNGIWICLREDNTPRWKVAVEYPMVNQSIEWTGAGFNGIYGGK